MESQNNIKNNENNSSNFNNDQSQGFLDSILSKDNEENKLFLKWIFGLSTAILLGILWMIFKVIVIYIQISKSSDIMRELEAIGDEGASVMDILQTISNIYNIFKFGIILLIVVLLLSYLKMRKENTVSNFIKINYLSAVGVALTGILEIIKVEKYVNLITNPPVTEVSIMSEQQEFTVSLLFLILVITSTVTNCFKVFKNKDFEVTDV